ncbi:hypothetical protein Taro_044137 [Colocasia esculenta]|uniref:Uncharacterized protein n=1 Tax=Colocasia esculenta TaxID=4460 RepID=A0A843WIB7_COLES|nr:hypothetical protein [Colocasia esculenta]
MCADLMRDVRRPHEEKASTQSYLDPSGANIGDRTRLGGCSCTRSSLRGMTTTPGQSRARTGKTWSGLCPHRPALCPMVPPPTAVPYTATLAPYPGAYPAPVYAPPAVPPAYPGYPLAIAVAMPYPSYPPNPAAPYPPTRTYPPAGTYPPASASL